MQKTEKERSGERGMNREEKEKQERKKRESESGWEGGMLDVAGGAMAGHC